MAIFRNPFRNTADFGHLHANTDNLLLKIVNVVVFAFFFSSNLYGNLGGHGYHFHGPDTYITPASYVFQIWGLIVLLLLGFVIYQFFDSAQPAVLGIGWRFALLGVLNAVFVHLWVQGLYLIAFIFSILVAASVSAIYYSLTTKHHAKTDVDAILVHLPFSLWHAWSLVMIFISAFAAFAGHDGHNHHPNVLVLVLVILTEIFFALTALGYVFSSKKGDIAGAIVLAWTLFGIYDRQGNDLISFFALGCAILACVAILKALYFTFIAGDGRISLGDGERAPLIA
ncbi:putative membrane permease [Pseudohyphozyma bogoriensis]|nr:putative membrane permease [Pseudohyphozyma bogoriensis]